MKINRKLEKINNNLYKNLSFSILNKQINIIYFNIEKNQTAIYNLSGYCSKISQKGINSYLTITSLVDNIKVKRNIPIYSTNIIGINISK